MRHRQPDMQRNQSGLGPEAEQRKQKDEISLRQSGGVCAQRTKGCDGMRAALNELVDAFEFQQLDIVDSVVEGSRAAIHIRFTVRSRATGKTAVTESLDLLEFRDGKLASYTQFFDTATADRLTSVANA